MANLYKIPFDIPVLSLLEATVLSSLQNLPSASAQVFSELPLHLIKLQPLSPPPLLFICRIIPSPMLLIFICTLIKLSK